MQVVEIPYKFATANDQNKYGCGENDCYTNYDNTEEFICKTLAELTGPELTKEMCLAIMVSGDKKPCKSSIRNSNNCMKVNGKLESSKTICDDKYLLATKCIAQNKVFRAELKIAKNGKIKSKYIFEENEKKKNYQRRIGGGICFLQ